MDGYWTKLMKDDVEMRRMIDWLEEQLSIKNVDEWYRVSLSQMKKLVPITSSKDFSLMLQKAYPQYQWELHLLGKIRHKKTAQRQLITSVKELFPNQSKSQNTHLWCN